MDKGTSESSLLGVPLPSIPFHSIVSYCTDQIDLLSEENYSFYIDRDHHSFLDSDLFSLPNYMVVV